jgi:hypothetical protein
MKSFTEYLTESKKTYEFKIKVAGDLSEDFSSNLNSAMEKFAVVKLSKGKRTPIQDVPLDFPNLKNSHVTVFDLECHYPTTPQVLEAYVTQACGCTAGSVVVRTANEPSEQYEEQMNEKTTPVLGEPQESDVDKTAQNLVGEKHISSFLKDLARDSKDLCAGQPKEKESPMPEASVGISPVGSKQNTIPSPVKGK